METFERTLQSYMPQVPPQTDAEMQASLERAWAHADPARFAQQQASLGQQAFFECEGPRWIVSKMRDYVETKRLRGHDVAFYEGRGWIRRTFAVRGERAIVETVARYAAAYSSEP